MTVAKRLIVVVAGTEHMLGTMDGVFAPIVRQFKRIRLTPFISPSETRECLLLRLRQVGKEAVLDHDTYHELHQLAEGHPYEAQLIAHHAYRRFAERPDRGFSVTVTVLNDVLAEVERFRADGHQNFASRLRSYTREELLRLAAIVEYPHLSLYEKAKIDAAMAEPGRVKEKITRRRNELKRWAESFVKDKIIALNSKTKGYEVAGDQFDKLYAKLLASSQRVPWALDDRSLVELTEEVVVTAMGSTLKAREYPSFFIERNVGRQSVESSEAGEPLAFADTRFGEVLRHIARFIRSWEFRRVAEQAVEELLLGKTPHVWMPTCLADAGALAALWLDGESVTTAEVRLRNPENSVETSIWLQPANFRVSRSAWQQHVEEYLSEHRWGLEALGWNGTLVRIVEEKSMDIAKILDLCRTLKWPSVLEYITEYVMQYSTIVRYIGGQADRSEFIARTALEFTTGLRQSGHLNNLAYMLMKKGELTNARNILEGLCSSSTPAVDLPRYNLAVCKALSGKHREALVDLRDLERLMTAERFHRHEASVLMVLETATDGGMLGREELDISIEQATSQSIKAILVNL